MEENSLAFLLYDKPEGVTSHTAVRRAAKALGFSRAGHAGTLDPMATGLLLIGLGRATRLLEHLVGLDKEYLATVRLGVETDSLDREGKVQNLLDHLAFPGESEIEEALSRFRGRIIQRPPVFSSIKQGGVPLHRRARRGEEVEAPEREVEIFALELLAVNPPELELKIRCSSGTYVRSLARDIGKSLNLPAALWALRRTACGPFSVADAAKPEEVGAKGLMPVSGMVGSLPRAVLDWNAAAALSHGRAVARADAFPEGADVAAFDEKGEIIAVCVSRQGFLVPRKVLAEQG